ncbi:hypothetical protein [Yoonia sp. R2-816]|uniref:hypothetical protein n=1 Tax=Yoonia sp. R2-816 TaxID=3342638 RepID=UPI003727E071
MNSVLRLITLSVLTVFVAAKAEAMTLDELGQFCTGSGSENSTTLDPAAQFGFCLGLIQGSAYVLHSNCVLGNGTLGIGKIGQMPTNTESVSRFVAWWDNNKELGAMDASLGLFLALQTLYPCEQ